MRLLPVLLLALLPVSLSAAELRLGIIGLDTSHVTAFTQILNDPKDPQHVPGAKVVAAFKSSSEDIESSRTKVDGYTQTLVEKYGVTLAPSIEALCQQVDAVLIESVDGRPHLAQARPVIAARKPLFIDKPIGGTLKDALEIFRLAKEAGVPVFTSSVFRYYDSMVELKKAPVGDIRSVISYGPAHLEPTHPDLYWYGVHPTEALYATIGQGCLSVTRTHTENTDTVVGTWSGGRTGILHGLRGGPLPRQVTIFGTKAVAVQKNDPHTYAPLVREIVKFFQTGQSPVPAEETIEMFAFMEAADESKRRGGIPVTIAEVLEKAKKP